MTLKEINDLWEEAKRRYPPGTRFEVAHKSGVIRTVKSHDAYNSRFVHESGLHINMIVEKEGDSDGASVYFNGTWAEIVELPKQKEKMTRFKTERELLSSGWTFTNGAYRNPKSSQAIVSLMLPALGEPYKLGTCGNLPNCGTSWNVTEQMLTEEPLISIGSKVAKPKTKRGKPYSSSESFYEYTGIYEKLINTLPVGEEERYYHAINGNFYFASEILEAYERMKEESKRKIEILLEKAIEDYPIGTTASNSHYSNTFTIKGTPFIQGNGRIVAETDCPKYTQRTLYSISSNEWAKVVNKPIVRKTNLEIAKEKYKPGTKVFARHLKREAIVTDDIYVKGNDILFRESPKQQIYLYHEDIWTNIIEEAPIPGESKNQMSFRKEQFSKEEVDKLMEYFHKADMLVHPSEEPLNPYDTRLIYSQPLTSNQAYNDTVKIKSKTGIQIKTFYQWNFKDDTLRVRKSPYSIKR